MKKFQLHPDGWAIIENEGVIYMDTPANLELDSGLQCPPCPAGAVASLYVEGKFNAAYDADGNQFGGDEDCRQHFDALIANVAALVAAKQAREHAEDQQAVEAQPVV